MTVSVVLTVHRRLDYLGEALGSVAAQTFQDYEVVVADDSGRAAARSICEATGDPRVRYHANPESLGIALSLRAALGRARGRFIAILNDDDLWEPQFLERLVPPLEARADRVVAFSDHWIIGEDGAVDPAATAANTARYGRDGLPEGDLADPRGFVLRQNGLPLAMASVFRASAVRPDQLARDVEGAYDFWMSCRLAAGGGRFYYVPARLTRYRVHPRMESLRRDPEKTLCLGFIARELLADPAFASERGYLTRWLAALTVRAGRDYLYFNRVQEARRAFDSAFKLAAGWKPVAGYLMSMVPRRLRQAVGVSGA